LKVKYLGKCYCPNQKIEFELEIFFFLYSYDYRNFCGCESYPLLKTINRVLRNYPGPGPNCFLKPVPPKHEDNVPQTTGTQYEEDETLSDDTIVIDSKSNRCNRTGELYQHEGDCAKFASCENGLIKIYDCPPGLHFNFVSAFYTHIEPKQSNQQEQIRYAV
jgi:Chitin binding Peritrophin-A domain.